MIDLQFGTGDVACHLVLELYDRGNMVLTDRKYLILNILRPRVAQETKFLARETYPVDQCRSTSADNKVITPESVKADIINQSALGKPIKKVLVSHVDQGPAFLDHLLSEAGKPGFFSCTFVFVLELRTGFSFFMNWLRFFGEAF